ncbi:hypothetical protein [Motilibacter aurantiacus]|uniref:hypothetical protein n=1 Tax=Motilibacter aurantiacus TaxID=2714955 RepID=UPI00140D3F60|nr:hypothetical protein [Motilibacter aurantiacus]NHC44838.1 hypothetical protein [Motilibacter aurantiacus]
MSFALRSRPAPEPVRRYVWGQLPDGSAVTDVEPVVLAGNTWEARHEAVTGFLARHDLAGHACVRLVVEEQPPGPAAPPTQPAARSRSQRGS